MRRVAQHIIRPPGSCRQSFRSSPNDASVTSTECVAHNIRPADRVPQPTRSFRTPPCDVHNDFPKESFAASVRTPQRLGRGDASYRSPTEAACIADIVAVAPCACARARVQRSPKDSFRVLRNGLRRTSISERRPVRMSTCAVMPGTMSRSRPAVVRTGELSGLTWTR